MVPLAVLLIIGCGGASNKCLKSVADAETTVSPTAEATAPDAVSGASKVYYAKAEHWKEEDLLAAFRNHREWSAAVFFAMATVDKKGRPNVASIVPYAVRDNVLIFANQESVTRANIESTGISHAIFRSVKEETANPKFFDYFGVVGSRLTLELVRDDAEREALWKEYQQQGAPASPPNSSVDDHFFMKIVEIQPIG